MTEAVLDASAILKWFAPAAEQHAAQAHGLRADFAAGQLIVFAPPLLFLEILNVAGGRWHWEAAALRDLAAQIDRIGFELQEPDIASTARWVAAGLTAYDAAYVALAESLGVPLITDDDLILAKAGGIAHPLEQAGPRA